MCIIIYPYSIYDAKAEYVDFNYIAYSLYNIALCILCILCAQSKALLGTFRLKKTRQKGAGRAGGGEHRCALLLQQEGTTMQHTHTSGRWWLQVGMALGSALLRCAQLRQQVRKELQHG
jgi:hypothetical protein